MQRPPIWSARRARSPTGGTFHQGPAYAASNGRVTYQRADRHVEISSRRKVERVTTWNITRTTPGVKVLVAGVRIDLHRDAALSLAVVLVDTLEQDLPLAPALQLVA